jgi:hypothetical protein
VSPPPDSWLVRAGLDSVFLAPIVVAEKTIGLCALGCG